MADPISILGTVLSVLGLGIRLTSTLSELIETWKSAPREILDLYNDITDLNVVLNHARNALRAIEDNPSYSEEFASTLSDHLGKAKDLLDELELDIRHLHEIKGFKKRLKWLRSNASIERKNSRLRGTRLRINELLTAHNVLTGGRIELDLKSIQFAVHESRHTIEPKLDAAKAKMDAVTHQLELVQTETAKSQQDLVELTSSMTASLTDVNKFLGQSRWEGYQFLAALAERMNAQQDEVTKKLDAISSSVKRVEDAQGPKDARFHRRSAGRLPNIKLTCVDRSETCFPGCVCSCHSVGQQRYKWRMPRAFQAVLGMLFFRYSGYPGQRPACDSEVCLNKGYLHLEISYVFPPWFLQLGVYAVLSRAATGEPSFGLIMRPRVLWKAGGVFDTASRGDTELLQTCLQRDPGCIHYAVDMGLSPLQMAISYGRVETARMLLQAGADPSVEDDMGDSAGKIAARVVLLREWPSEILAAIEELFKPYQYIEELELAPASQVILRMRTGDLASIIAGSTTAQLNERDELGNTPLFWAVMAGNAKAVQLLLRNGADPNAQDRRGFSILARSLGSPANTEAFSLLIEHGANLTPARPDYNGMYPFHWACMRNRLSEVKKMVAAGVAVDFPSERGLTGLGYAAFSDSVEVATYLLDMGADINHADTDGCIPFVYATRDAAHKCLRLFLDRDADYLSAEGGMILHLAAACGDEETMTIFAEHGLAGLDVDNSGDSGRTARQRFDARGSSSPALSKAFERLLESVRAAGERHVCGDDADESTPPEDEDEFHDTTSWQDDEKQ